MTNRQIKNSMMVTLAIIIVLAFFALMAIGLFTQSISEPLLNTLFGALTASFSAVVMYFFGSSKGSADKTEIMERSITKSQGHEDDKK